MCRLPYIIVLMLAFSFTIAQNPHGATLKIDCAQCHNPAGWELDYETLQFDHATTNFQLEGSHEQTDCKACHSTLVFKGAATDCISCHTDVHSQSVGNDCMRCHTSDSWLVFDTPELHEQNGFPLIGAHSNLSCVECHSNETTLIFNPIGNDCFQCHNDDYSAAIPNHDDAGFSTDCLQCHDPLGFGWDAQDIIHDFFPLTQGHDIEDCSQCHDVGNFSNISAECIDCHEDDFLATTNPDHQAANLPTDCIQCHTTAPGWMPATIDHEFFPLTLGHDIEDCNACHIGGDYTNTPTDCFACHEDDYNATNDPDHQAAGFPTDCVTCHTTNPGWMPATFDHDFFPIYSGPHDNEWSQCLDCHTNPGDFSVFTCITCHTEGDMADDHDGVSGYIYESNACLQCHPNGID